MTDVMAEGTWQTQGPIPGYVYDPERRFLDEEWNPIPEDTRLVLSLARSSLQTVLASWRSDNPYFRVVWDDTLAQHQIRFVTEDEWARGELHQDDATRIIDLAGLNLRPTDLADMALVTQGRDPFCERFPDVCPDA